MTLAARGLTAGLLCVVFSACTMVHNVEIDVDRLTYNDAVGNSREGQALMNLVRIRYGEFPSFVDLTQLVTNYETRDQITVGAVYQPPPGREDNKGDSKEYFSLLPTYTGAVVENPSMVYKTVQGPELVRKLLVPSQISVILALSRTGWAIDRLLATMVTSVNGKHNRQVWGGRVWEAEPEFLHFVEVLSRLQAADAVWVRFDPPSAKEAAARVEAVGRAVQAATSAARVAALSDLGPEPVKVSLCIREKRLSAEDLAELEELRTELGLARGVECYRVVTAEEPTDERKIAVQMRSLYQLLQALAVDIEVPEDELEEGVTARLDRSGEIDRHRDFGRIDVRSGSRAPGDALVRVKYGRRWFWIDGGDLRSKETFNALVLLLSITESGGTGAQLVVTTN